MIDLSKQLICTEYVTQVKYSYAISYIVIRFTLLNKIAEWR